MKKKVAAITSSRADYSHLYWPLKLLEADSEIELTIVAMAAHMSPEYGNTWQEIAAENFSHIETIECLLSSDTDLGMAKSLGLATLSLADKLAQLKPDLVLIIADRYEMLAPANVALTLRIPILHIEGGDISEGAIDDAVRNALTKMSHIHFTPTEKAKRRVLAMGEEEWRVHFSGAPSLDHIAKSKLKTKQEIKDLLGLSDEYPIVIVTLHSVSLLNDATEEVTALFDALDKHKFQYVFSFPNADLGSHIIMQKAEAFCKSNERAQIHVNLGALNYFSLLSVADCMIGNSSSGIMETPSFCLPTINVGLRQKGREQAKNIIDVKADKKAISNAITQALSSEFRESIKDTINPYGNGDASVIIRDVIKSLPERDVLLFKKNQL
ncbi:UDP-N-acetylglucosamine 2-epimerase [Pseudoalteromonas sp. T1lg24]|uniref:UDP-N-acetylglucosamine 2-epimerase n=1 Tax=Pseudoalteromonas sp. T1lg24 TaxID=2077099 RepID=UPI000CF6343E|nr:UDP-N-acetylglucosamine 2-epimerase [Pseudoalteromonas sp. T1lg24]